MAGVCFFFGEELGDGLGDSSVADESLFFGDDDGVGVGVGDFFFVEGIDENAEELRTKIYELVKTNNVKLLRKYYRLMLVAREDWPVDRDAQQGG